MLKTTKWLLPCLLLVATVSVVALFFISANENPHHQDNSKDDNIGGNFDLWSMDGKVSLSDFKGKVVILYFGFINCPKVCPVSMSVIKRTLSMLSPQQVENTQALLVSIDPERDTPEKLAEFTRSYHPNILGLTGSAEEIEQVAEQYGAYFKVTASETVDSDYAYRHSSRYYVIDQDGELVQAMRHSSTPNEIVARVVQVLEN